MPDAYMHVAFSIDKASADDVTLLIHMRRHDAAAAAGVTRAKRSRIHEYSTVNNRQW